MAKFGIKAKIWMSIAIFGAGYIALLVLLQWTSSETQKHMQVASGSLFPAALISQRANAGFQKVIKRYSDAVLMQDKKILASAEEDADTVATALGSAQEKTSFSPERQQQVALLGQRFAEIRARSKSLYGAMIEHPDSMTAATQQEIAALARDNKEMDAALEQLQHQIAKDFQAELDAVRVWSQRQRTLGIIVLLIAVLCGGGVSAMVVERNIAAPLRQLTACFQDVAEGDGDLTKRVEIVTQDELGELARWFNEFLNKLNRIMSQVAATAEHVASASAELSSSATLQAQGAERQKDQATQVAAAMREMSCAVQQVSENCTRAAEASRRAAGTASEGGTVVEATLAQMRSIAASVAGTAKKMGELGRSSDQIGQIAGVIDDIADQTNLLALNAAIEAARAGEQGRGFAVVADEVRKLAERTTKATQEIATMIESIQVETKNAVQAMEVGSREVESGVTTTSASGVALKQIIEMSKGVGDMIAQIATSANQQSKATEEINSTVAEISSATRESSVAAEQTAKACTDLSALAFDLQKVVGQFKLDSRARRNPADGSNGNARAVGAGSGR